MSSALFRPKLSWVAQRSFTPARASHSFPNDVCMNAVVGEVRAKILRQCARRPTMGDVATRLAIAPGTVTYHCQQLEDAGVIAAVASPETSAGPGGCGRDATSTGRLDAWGDAEVGRAGRAAVVGAACRLCSARSYSAFFAGLSSVTRALDSSLRMRCDKSDRWPVWNVRT